MLRYSQPAVIFTVALIALLSSVLFPSPATAHPPNQGNAPEAPEAPLDTPAIIVNEHATEWLIHKGVIYWSNHCSTITLASNAPTDAAAPSATQDITATLKRMPTGGGAVTTLGTDAINCLNFSSIAADDSGAYFYDGIGKIKVIRTTGISPTPITTDVTTNTIGLVSRIRTDETFVYFSTESANIFRVPKTGGAAQAVQTTAFGIADFILDGQSIYWFDNGGLWWGPKTCTTLPCSKTSLSSGTHGRNMAFGSIGGSGSSPGSIIFVSNNNRIIELNCTSPGICQLQNYYTSGTGWSIRDFKVVPLASGSGPIQILQNTLFWIETDGSTGRLLRRLRDASNATPSEIYPGADTLNRMETDSKGVYFADGSKIMFLPFTASAITRDLAVAGIEVTQAIQNIANQMGLVADKPTVARVYGKQISGPPAGSVEMVLHGTRNGLPLPGSPLQPVNGNVSINTSFVFDRAKAYDSWTFRLPASWISAGNIVLRAQIDPRNRYEDPTVANDSLSQTAAFGREPNACLFFSPVRTDNPIPHVGDPKFWETMDRFARVWPVPGVNVYSMSDPIEELQVCTWHGFPYPCFGPYEIDQGISVGNFPSDKDRLIGKLMLRQAAARTLSLTPGAGYCQSGATVHSVGLVHPDADTTDDDGTLLGYANYYINASFYKMEPFDSQPIQGSLAWVWPEAASVLAQEVTHNFNRRHVACGTNDDTDSNWPYVNKCQLNDGGATAYYGFDVKSRIPIAPEIASDFMSYTPRHADAPLWKGQWVSDYTYGAVKGKFGLQAQNLAGLNADNQTRTDSNLPGLARPGLVRPTLPEAGEMIYAIGAIEPISNLGHLDYSYAQPLAALSAQARSVWQEFSAPSWRSPSEIKAAEAITYHLRLKNASGVVLDDRAVTPFEADAHEGETPAWPFLVTFPAPNGTVTKMELMANNGSVDAVLDTLNVGAAMPTVSILSPKAGDNVSDTLTIVWQANDADKQDVLHYNVQYSPDNGTNWIPLVEDHPGTPGVGAETLTVQNPLALPGTNGAQARVRIFASDGYHTASAFSDAFSVGQRAPVAHITSPDAAISYDPNDEIALRGGAIDAESGVLTSTALSWAVNGVASGNGEESSVRGLKPGTHTVALTATDNTSRTGTAQTTLHINPLVASESSSGAALDGLCDDFAYSSGAHQIQLAPYADGAQATAQLMVNGTKLWVCFSGLARGSDAQVGRAGIFADVNRSNDATSQPDDVGFFVTEDGVGIATLGNGAAGASTRMDARTAAAGMVWSAEMSIDLASLGGNGHAIEARLSHSFVNSASDAVAWPYLAQASVPNSWGLTVLGNWPELEVISPVSATVSSGNLLLTLSGNNFTTSTVALLDGVALNTTFISATQMSAVVPAAKLTAAGIANVQVAGANAQSAPSPAAGLAFAVVNPAPTLTTLTPDFVAQGSAISVTVMGSNFAPGAVVLFEGQALPTTVLSSTQVRAQLSAAQLQAGRVVNVSVQNAAPSSGLSNALPFLVTSPRTVYLPFARK